MARRGGRPGDWLATDSWTGFTEYGSALKRDWWGNYSKRPLIRNLQEIATPLDDPGPVPFYLAQDYEASPPCAAEVAPEFVGNTNVPTNPNNAAFQALDLDTALGEMVIGCTFRVF